MIHEPSQAILDSVQSRHECIRQIRKRHDGAWPKLSMLQLLQQEFYTNIKDDDGNGNNKNKDTSAS